MRVRLPFDPETLSLTGERGPSCPWGLGLQAAGAREEKGRSYLMETPPPGQSDHQGCLWVIDDTAIDSVTPGGALFKESSFTWPVLVLLKHGN